MIVDGRERKKSSTRRVEKPCSSIKIHGMKTRKDKSLLARGVGDLVKESSGPSLVK